MVVELKTVSEIDKIAATHLGRVGGEGYSDQYDPSLLVAIPRYHNRIDYGIDLQKLPFVGYDVWDCYEVSALCTNGYPVTGMLKIVYPSDSELHVESKSIKLYLNSLNMTMFGNSVRNTIRKIETTVEDDLSALLQTRVQAHFHTSVESTFTLGGFTNIDNLESYNGITFDQYKSDASMLTGDRSNYSRTLKVKSANLRSNCRVTGQPDWGNIFIHIKGSVIPTPETLMKYIVSHRSVNHFHEEICEMTFMHLKEAFNPDELMVACLYSRRGGIGINPIRATHVSLIPRPFINPSIQNTKMLMQ